MAHYERRLPHWDVVGSPLFVTFRLHGSLPANRVFPPGRLTSGEAFVAMDRIRDGARSGPLFLQRPEIAELIVAALHDGERFHRYELHSWVIMANHVHILVTPRIPSTRWLGPLKGFTAHRANQLLNRQGFPFWQDESYDHLVRSADEFRQIRKYIENNPVTAGLNIEPASYEWSSAGPAESRLQAEKPAPHYRWPPPPPPECDTPPLADGAEPALTPCEEDETEPDETDETAPECPPEACDMPLYPLLELNPPARLL
jgi:REP element-mobilizing transposase RayT